MKQYYSSTQLASLQLVSLPHSRVNVAKKAERENWPFKEVAGKGGKGGVRREYLVPDYVLEEIKSTQIQELLENTASTALPALSEPQENKPEYLTSRQTIVEGARKSVISAVETLMQLSNLKKKTAVTHLLIEAEQPQNLSLRSMLQNAADARGSTGKLPSVRTILRWFDQAECNKLAPKIRQTDFSTPDWAATFLAIWQQPQKPTISSAYRDLKDHYQGELPSEYQVRRFINKLGNVSKHKGRMLPRELKNIQVFVRRTFDTLLPTDIYTADGHTFDAEVQHPLHGQMFRPEITTVADVGTRKIVGYSVDLAESGLAVLAAVSHAVKNCGIPALFYVDNGSGYKNVLMSDVSTGVMGRLGTTMVHSIPYNSQARGVIERLHKTVWVDGAKKFASYMGADMDPQAKQLVFKKSRKELKVKGDLIGSKYIPQFEQFLKFCEEQVEQYNNNPHRSLPKIIDINGVKRHMTPNEVWEMKLQQGAEITSVDEGEALYLLMPQIQRTIRRGEIEFNSNRYFSNDLAEFNGDVMNIGYDVNDASQVWVFDDLGRLVCTAEFNGNAQDYMPKTVIQAASDKRADGRIKRAMVKVDEARLEHKGSMLIEHQDSVTVSGMNISVDDLVKVGQRSMEKMAAKLNPQTETKKYIAAETVTTEEFIIPADEHEKYQQFLISSQKPVEKLTDKEARWLTTYPKTAEYRVFSRKTINL